MLRSIVTAFKSNPALFRSQTLSKGLPLCKNSSLVTVSRFSGLRQFSDNSEASGTTTGRVKWFDTKKGFGFISPSDGSQDIFVHQTSIHAEGFRSLAEGEEVEFEIHEEGNGRRKAQGVTGPGGSYVQGAPRPSFNDNGYDY